MAGGVGFEPTFTVLETALLPLHHPPVAVTLGFEPRDAYASVVFKATGLNHSPKSPLAKVSGLEPEMKESKSFVLPITPYLQIYYDL